MSHHSETPVGIVQEELEAHDIEYIVIESKHMKVRFHIEGRRYTYTVPKTTSDGRRTRKNCRSGIRRLLRQAGVEPVE